MPDLDTVVRFLILLAYAVDIWLWFYIWRCRE